MVAPWKTKLVEDLEKDLGEYSVCGIVDISGIPSRQFQKIRKTLGDDVIVKVGRKRLLLHALDNKGIKQLDDYMDGSVGIVCSNLDPFQLEKKLYGCMNYAAAKPGQIAPSDIVIEAGDTGLPAGPVIGEIQNAGIKAKIDGGKIVIMKSATVVNAGDAISEELAPVLKRLGVEPMEISLTLKAVFDGKTVYTGEVLHVDVDEVFGKFMSAHQQAFNLAYNTGYFTKDTVPLLLQKAFMDAVNLSLNAEVINKETLPTFLSKADAQAKALKTLVPEELKAEKKNEGTPAEDVAADASAKEEAVATEEAPDAKDAPAEEKVDATEAKEENTEKPAEE